ncbi:MAG: galactokinase family protein [Phycisphaeraceae bacterium]
MTATLSLSELGAPEAVTQRLEQRGLHGERAARKAKLFQRAAATLEDRTGAPLHALFIPGRIEVLGKHVDYAGGHSITCAIDRGFCVIARVRNDDQIRLIRADGEGEAQFRLDPDLLATPGDWTNYPMTCARRVARNFPSARRGADIAFLSDLPPAAGLSSSSAFIVAIFFALARVNDLENDPTYQQALGEFRALAGYLGAIENGSTFAGLAGDRGVGTFGGSQDHTAIIGSRADQLGLFGYCPVQLERYIDLPDGHTFAVGVSGAEAVKTGGAQQSYNNAAQLAADAAALWREKTGRDDLRLKDAIDSSPTALEQLREALKPRPELLQRFEHFYMENERLVPQAAEAFQRADLDKLGDVVDRSQQLAEQWLLNQVEPTIHLARSARQHGAAAASAFGAGFGGSVWALVRNDQLETFLEAWGEDYRAAFPAEGAHAQFFHAHPGPAAFELGGDVLAAVA